MGTYDAWFNSIGCGSSSRHPAFITSSICVAASTPGKPAAFLATMSDADRGED